MRKVPSPPDLVKGLLAARRLVETGEEARQNMERRNGRSNIYFLCPMRILRFLWRKTALDRRPSIITLVLILVTTASGNISRGVKVNIFFPTCNPNTVKESWLAAKKLCTLNKRKDPCERMNSALCGQDMGSRPWFRPDNEDEEDFKIYGLLSLLKGDYYLALLFLLYPSEFPLSFRL
ncbi:uncharacterized protein BDR25DRAFT_354416 [Lindgomyces ingoldianus]|uniref:Uncharacterized protein n=1 Tax=Lindgomyces ingoldianus TaxID=673940 RepID=A0ACB6QW40_9PLEO|nr:uncharacterized protein BDR25DRAFT_354416 [Lindgomyces ingoldianus]KAF2471151.1 hypothetical protein BDR25DRAFT_354416 [Lindgomyces ingoldianus]